MEWGKLGFDGFLIKKPSFKSAGEWRYNRLPASTGVSKSVKVKTQK